MTTMIIPEFPLVSILVAAVAAIGSLALPRANRFAPYDDTEQRIAGLTTKVQRQARLRKWMRAE